MELIVDWIFDRVGFRVKQLNFLLWVLTVCGSWNWRSWLGQRFKVRTVWLCFSNWGLIPCFICLSFCILMIFGFLMFLVVFSILGWEQSLLCCVEVIIGRYSFSYCSWCLEDRHAGPSVVVYRHHVWCIAPSGVMVWMADQARLVLWAAGRWAWGLEGGCSGCYGIVALLWAR